MQKCITAAAAAMLILGASAPAFAKVATLTGIDLHQAQDEFSKRRKPRVPGGSGCDDPRDLIEHPECRG